MSPSPLEEAATESRCPNSIPRQPQVKMMESTRTAERRELRAMYVSFDDQTRPAHRRSTDPDWLGWISKTGASLRHLPAVYHGVHRHLSALPAVLLDA